MNRRGLLLGGVAASATLASAVWAQTAPRLRVHTATSSQPLNLVAATQTVGESQVSISILGDERIIEANGLPGHKVGTFPNSGNPHAIKAQSHRFAVPIEPAGQGGDLELAQLFGVAINGVPFDPGAAEFWQGNPRLGWQYDALGGGVALGVDANYAHVQPSGAYHYHGIPVGLLNALGWSASKASPLVGWAADGHPVYALTAAVDGDVKEMTSSWQLRSGTRPGGTQPDGAYDGTFVQDYEFVQGSGDLDEYNGATVKTDEFPDGTYAYFLTRSYPVIPRGTKNARDGSMVTK